MDGHRQGGVRDPHLSPLVIAAHGSADPRFAAVVGSIAVQVRRARPDLDVRIGYLEHGPPHLSEVVEAGAVVVPLLLASGYHVRVDLPAQAPAAVVTPAVGPDPLLADALTDRLTEAGYDGQSPVVLAAAGSTDDNALTEVRMMAARLGARLGVEVEPAFVSAGTPRLRDTQPQAVSTYLLAPGGFYDAVFTTHAQVVSAPIGAHSAVAQIVLARYDAAQVPGRTAPA